MAKKDIVVVGASAGGMAALEQLVAGLPLGLPASLFVVWHLAPGVKSVLPMLLARAGPLPACNPKDGDPIEPGRIYVGPNDHHMLLENGAHFSLLDPRVHIEKRPVQPLRNLLAECRLAGAHEAD